MKISYLTSVRFPNEKANGIQIAKVCESLAAEGVQLTLFIPGRKTQINESPYEYYGVTNNFSIEVKKVFDLIKLGRVGFVLSQVLFGLRTLISTKNTIIISQDEWVLIWHVLMGRKCVYEVHNGRTNIATRVVSSKSELLVANSNGTKRFYVDRGVLDEKIIVCPNGVDLKRFDTNLLQEEARELVGLPKEKKIILYTGHLYDWKGTDTLARSIDMLPPDIIIVFVGGTEEDIEEFRIKFKNPRIYFLGHKPNPKIPLYLKAADILVLPNNKIGESEKFTSPMKLFEYLAVGKPIVASDLPSIREILNEENAFFFTPGDRVSLANVIKFIISQPELSIEKAHQAKIDAKKYTWNRSFLVSQLSEIK